MIKLTLDKVKQLAISAKGQINKIYLHWSAGHYAKGNEDLLYLNDYHISIDFDGAAYSDGNPLTTHKNHTYMRNTGAISVSIMCCADATSNYNMGTEPPTNAQIETMAQVLGVLCKYLELPVDLQHVMNHAEAGNNLDGEDPGYDSYGPDPNPDGSKGGDCERWDLWVIKQGNAPWSGGDDIRGKAEWYIESGELP